MYGSIALVVNESVRRRKLKEWIEARGGEVQVMKPSPASGWFKPPRYAVEFVDDEGVVYRALCEVQRRGILPVKFGVLSGTPRQGRPSFWLRKPPFD
jgi:hypothetical protein